MRKPMRLLAALTFVAASALAQSQAPATPPSPAQTPSQTSSQTARAQFFAGTVTELDKDHITLSRTLVGHPAENRTFRITPKTKIVKNLKVTSKATVRYQHREEGDVAMEIQISAQRRPVRPS